MKDVFYCPFVEIMLIAIGIVVNVSNGGFIANKGRYRAASLKNGKSFAVTARHKQGAIKPQFDILHHRIVCTGGESEVHIKNLSALVIVVVVHLSYMIKTLIDS